MERKKELLNLILERRSCRSYRPEPLDRPTLAAIVEAGRYAPSAMNQQKCHFYVITDRELLHQISAAVSANLKRFANTDCTYGAPALILVTNRRDNSCALQDAACAMENMFLAAHSMGIGSVWINQLQGICDEPSVRQVLTSLGIPENHVVYGLAALGYADDVKAEKERIGKVVIVE